MDKIFGKVKDFFTSRDFLGEEGVTVSEYGKAVDHRHNRIDRMIKNTARTERESLAATTEAEIAAVYQHKGFDGHLLEGTGSALKRMFTTTDANGMITGLRPKSFENLGLGIGAAVGLSAAAIAFKKSVDGDYYQGQGAVRKTAKAAFGVEAASELAFGAGVRGSSTLLGATAIGGYAYLRQSLATSEMISRKLLTGGSAGFKRGPTGQFRSLDSWLPNFRNMPLYNKTGEINVKKFAVNPSVVKRLALGGFAVGAVAGAVSGLLPSAAPATIFTDGVNVRRSGDMGVDASYAQGMLGANSSLNKDAMVRTLAHLL